MNNYFFKDYDEYLLMESGLANNGLKLWNSKVLQEDRGIIDDYDLIIDELYQAIIKTRPTPFNDSNCYLHYTLLDYHMNLNCFIETLNLTVLTGSNDDNSYFDGGRCRILPDGSKLGNVSFSISINNKELDTEVGKKEFYLMMTHELQHAYRFFNICLTNQSYVDRENDRKTKYETALKGSPDDGFIKHSVQEIYYKSERDEIMSEANKLYEYIKQHEEINSRNLKEYETELPLYPLIASLEETVISFEMFAHNRNEYGELIDVIGSEFNRIVGKDAKPNVWFVNLRNKVISAAMFARRKYRWIISHAFADFKRFIPVHESKSLKRITTWNEGELDNLLSKL